LVALLLVFVTACSDGATQTVVTTATGLAPTRLPDFDGPEALENAIVGFGECVERSFPIVVRFRPDAFIGLTTEVGSQRQEDGELVDNDVAKCDGEFDLDRRISTYQSAHPISAARDRELVAGFVSCASAVSPTMSELVSGVNLSSHMSVVGFLSDLRSGRAVLTVGELAAVSDCESDMTGPERVFSDGHPWFTP
jgi:hypothetical protein